MAGRRGSAGASVLTNDFAYGRGQVQLSRIHSAAPISPYAYIRTCIVLRLVPRPPSLPRAPRAAACTMRTYYYYYYRIRFARSYILVFAEATGRSIRRPLLD